MDMMTMYEEITMKITQSSHLLLSLISFLLFLSSSSSHKKPLHFSSSEVEEEGRGSGGSRGGSSSATTNTNNILLMTRQGQVLGQTDGHVSTFLGIPYAEPPTGRLRFRPPQPKPAWYPHTYNTLHYAPECLQSELIAGPADEEAGQERSEDCLYLNIWTPATTLQVDVEPQPQRRTSTSTRRGSSSSSSRRGAGDSKRVLLPVMIWFYGGAFIHGGSSRSEYNGYHLARRGQVVVVTFNYRVGALGFLVSISDGLYGNYGLADQKMVLQWVQDHIEAFGGDPHRVTLFGESAGAMSVGLHLLDQQLHASSGSSTTSSSSTNKQQSQQDATSSGSSGSTATRHSRRKLFHGVILQSNPFGYK